MTPDDPFDKYNETERELRDMAWRDAKDEATKAGGGEMSIKPIRTHYFVAGLRSACGKDYADVERHSPDPQKVTCKACIRSIAKVSRGEAVKEARAKLRGKR